MQPFDSQTEFTDPWMPAATPRTAVIHEWLTEYAGSERVLEQMLVLYPQAELFAVCDFLDEAARGFLRGRRPTVTSIQNMPFARRLRKYLLPLMALAVEQWDLSNYDIVLSSSHAVAKGVITGPDQLHVSYIHTPMRYAWDLQQQYLSGAGLNRGVAGFLARVLLHHLRMWDQSAALRVDLLVANSHFVARRVHKCYRRRANVIYPPVATESFVFCPHKDDFYLTASRLVPYKRVDLIVEAFTAMPGRKLIVIGDGPERERLQRLAGGNVEILGYQPAAVLHDYLRRARAFVFAAEEDFGIVAVEAQACGTPVIAFGRGGATETVVAEKTGVFFTQQSSESLQQAVAHFEDIEACLDPYDARLQAERFSVERFRRRMANFLSESWEKFSAKRRDPRILNNYV